MLLSAQNPQISSLLPQSKKQNLYNNLQDTTCFGPLLCLSVLIYWINFSQLCQPLCIYSNILSILLPQSLCIGFLSCLEHFSPDIGIVYSTTSFWSHSNIPCLDICIASIIIYILHQSGVFLTTDESTWIHLVDIRVRSWCCEFYAFG